MKSDNAEEEERQSNGTKKSFKCDQCNKNYTKQQTLEDHKQIHSSEFCCSINYLELVIRGGSFGTAPGRALEK